MEKLNRALDALARVFGDIDNQANIKKALANLSRATAGATEAMNALKDFATEAKASAVQARSTMTGISKTASAVGNRFDKLAGKLIEDAEQLSTLMATINKAAAKIDSGDGTAGRLINDPKLYNDLLDATREFGRLLKDFRQLVEEWKKKGGVVIKVE